MIITKPSRNDDILTISKLLKINEVLNEQIK